MTVVGRGVVVRRIIERTDMEQFAERVLDSFWDADEFQQFQPPRDRVRECAGTSTSSTAG